MGLMIAPDVDATDLEVDLDLATICQCPHPAADHDDAGCCACPCGACCWDGLVAEDLENADELEADAVRVTAALRAARARRRLLENERQERAAKDPASAPRSRSRRLKPMPTVEPKVPTLPPPADEDGRIRGLLSVEEEALEAIGA